MNLTTVIAKSRILNNRQASWASQFAVNALYVCCTVYVTALYLTSYPSTWLPYFFLGLAVTNIVVALVLNQLLVKTNLKFLYYLQGVLCLGSLILILLLPYDFYFLPMIISFFLMAASNLFYIISWSMLGLAFDILEFKHISNALTLANVVATITASILTLVLAEFWGTISIAYLIIILMMFSLLFCVQIKPVIIPKKEKIPTKAKVFNYLLYRKIFVFVFLINLLTIFIDYALNLKLAQTFDDRQISQYLSILMGASSALALAVSLFLVKPLLERYGVIGPLIIYPFCLIVGSLSLIFFPTLAVVTFLAASNEIFDGSFLTGQELVLNALPNSVGAAAKYQLRSLVVPAASLIGSLILLFFVAHLSTRSLAILIFIGNIAIWLYLKGLNKDYLTSLKEEMNLKRFTLDENIDETKLKFFKETFLSLLKSSKADLVRFGLSLFGYIKFKKIPPEMLGLLSSPQADIRISTIKLVSQFPENTAVNSLLKRVDIEDDMEARWWLYQAIANIAPKALLARARKEAVTHDNQLGALHVLLVCGGIDDVIYSLRTLKRLLNESRDPLVRKIILRSLSNLTVGNFGNELIEIIHSADSQVASFAIDIVTEKHWFELMPAIIKGLKKGAYFYHTKLAVLAMGEKAIPILMQNLQEETDNAKVVQLVKILAIIPSHKTEPHLLELAKGGNVVSRNSLAKALAIFALHFNFRPDFLRKLEKIALNEIKFITQLKEIAKNEQRQFVINEIIARITMLQTRFLYWFAILTKPAEIVPLISIILVSSRLEKAKAVEVLLTVSDKAEWGDAIENIFFNDADMNIEQPTMPIQECQDPWLVRVINYPNDLVPGITMDNMQKVFTLRAVELFKELNAEVLFPLAQQTQLIDLVRDKIIFSQGDKANGLYIIVSGEVTIFRDDKEVAVLHENDFFGELGLLDEAPRSATAIGKTDGVLMFLDKNSFEALTDDFPEVLRAVMQVVLKYLRSYMGK